MKKHILLLIISFVSVSSHAQCDFLEESLNNISSAPSYLVVKVKSLSYEGDAVIESWRLMNYYETIKNDSSEFYDSIWMAEDWKLAYQDIKQNKYFIISDEYLGRKFSGYRPYYFEKIIPNDSVLNISKKGIDFFIRTYFEDNGFLIPHYRQKESYDFNTIVKIIFDAGIMAGTGC